MDLKYFPQFIRYNYKEFSSLPNSTLMEIGVEFKKYLLELIKEDSEILNKIGDISPKTVVLNQIKNKPFLINGYSPALIIHFNNFVEKTAKEYDNELKQRERN